MQLQHICTYIVKITEETTSSGSLESLCKFVSYKVGVQKYVIIGYVMDMALVIFNGRESIRGSFVQRVRTY